MAQIRQLVELMDQKWAGFRPKDIPVMPKHVLARDWQVSGILAGLNRETVKPAVCDLKQRQFLMISSAGSAQGKQLLCALTAQAAKQFPQKTLALYDPGEEILAKFKPLAGEYFNSADAFDRYIAGLMPVLQKRKESQGTEEGRQWLAEQPEILIVISDHKRCHDAVSSDTMRRLSNIIHLGAGLKVCLLILSNAEERSGLSLDMFCTNLNNKADILMVDGSFRSHGYYDSQLDYNQSSEELPEGDAWLLMDGQAQRIKFVEFEA